MNEKIEQFIVENHIAIYVDADLENGKFIIKRMDIPLESENLFKQLLLFNNIENLQEYVSGQWMPKFWTQGNTKCIMCQPNDAHILVLFFENCLDVRENYFLMKRIDIQLKEIWNGN